MFSWPRKYTSCLLSIIFCCLWVNTSVYAYQLTVNAQVDVKKLSAQASHVEVACQISGENGSYVVNGSSQVALTNGGYQGAVPVSFELTKPLIDLEDLNCKINVCRQFTDRQLCEAPIDDAQTVSNTEYRAFDDALEHRLITYKPLVLDGFVEHSPSTTEPVQPISVTATIIKLPTFEEVAFEAVEIATPQIRVVGPQPFESIEITTPQIRVVGPLPFEPVEIATTQIRVVGPQPFESIEITTPQIRVIGPNVVDQSELTTLPISEAEGETTDSTPLYPQNVLTQPISIIAEPSFITVLKRTQPLRVESRLPVNNQQNMTSALFPQRVITSPISIRAEAEFETRTIRTGRLSLQSDLPVSTSTSQSASNYPRQLITPPLSVVGEEPFITIKTRSNMLQIKGQLKQ